MSAVDAEGLAARIDRAWLDRETIEPISEQDGVRDAATAYTIQQAWLGRRLADGDRVMGRKIGLTNVAVQQQLGVDEPDYGALLRSRYFPADGGSATAPTSLFLQPRVEGELAFLIAEAPASAEPTIEEVLAVTEAIAPAIEIVDSRIADWRITLADTIADNASFGGFTVGPWDRDLQSRDLAAIGMTFAHDGTDKVVRGTGAAALDHPARAVGWLLARLSQLGVAVSPGDIVLSGALAPMLPVSAGDSFTLQIDDQPELRIAFT